MEVASVKSRAARILALYIFRQLLLWPISSVRERKFRTPISPLDIVLQAFIPMMHIIFFLELFHPFNKFLFITAVGCHKSSAYNNSFSNVREQF